MNAVFASERQGTHVADPEVRGAHAVTALARSAAALMLLSALMSGYWAAGVTGLLDTVGGSIARWGRAGGAGVHTALARIVALKLLPAWLPVRAARAPYVRTVWRLAWLEAAILTVYGGVLTAADLAVQAGILKAGASVDWKALDWHAYLWDPRFLIAGLFVLASLRSASGILQRRATRATSGGLQTSVE
jgi:hypothetical protein